MCESDSESEIRGQGVIPFSPWLQKTGFVLLFVSLFLASPWAQASKKERLLLYHFKENNRFSATDAGWVKRLSRWALKRQPGFTVVSAASTTSAAEPQMTTKDKVRLTLLKKNIGHAKVLYRFRKYAYSMKRLKLAMKLTKAVFQWIKDDSLVRDIYVYMAVNALYLRQGQVTREYVLKAVNYDGEYVPEGSKFPSTFVTYYKSVRNWLQKQPTYRLKMSSVPAGAKVYFNLKLVGRTPVTVQGIKPGKHAFHVTKPSYQTWNRTATINPKSLGNRRELNNTVMLKKDPGALSLEGIPVFAQGADLDSRLLNRMQRLCIKYNAIHLLVLKPLQRGGMRYLKLARFRRGERTIRYRLVMIGRSRSQHKAKVLAFARTLSQALVPAAHRSAVVVRPSPIVRPRPRPRPWVAPRRRWRPRPRPVVQIRPRPRPVIARVTPPPRRQEPGSEPAVHQTWWFWTLLGGGLVVATGTTVAVLILSQPPPSATFIIATPEQKVSSSLTKR